MKNKGFTLLEMVVVVIIVSILLLLTVPNVSKVITSVDNRACSAQTKVIDSAIAQFKLDYGTMPNSITDLINAGYINQDQATCSNGNGLAIVEGHCVEEY